MDHSAPASAVSGCESCDLRCECGRLVARLTLRGIEIKCARCKHTVVVGWTELAFGKPRAIDPRSTPSPTKL
jgi:hypothetical protein